MMKIRLSMSGELLKMAPVSGLRSGASGSTVSSVMDGDGAEQAVGREAQAAGLAFGQVASLLGGVDVGVARRRRRRGGLGDPLRHERDDEGDEHRRGDGEPQVGGEVDRPVRVGEVDRLVGHLGQQAVERGDAGC